MALKILAAVARSRLAQFLVFGGLIFAVAPGSGSPNHISLHRRYLDALETAEARRNQLAQLAPARAIEVDERAIEDEVLYREAVRLGLDQGDPLVRQHLIQKMLLLAEDLGGATRTPTDAELKAFFAENHERWAQPGATRFIHVFGSSAAQLAALTLDEGATTAPEVGDAFPLARDVRKTDPDLTAAFGAGFASTVTALAPGAWSAPVQSTFGWHRVKVLERTPPHAATFDEVRGQLPLDFAVERRKAAVKAFLTRALRRYRIDVDGHAVPNFDPEGRMGARSEPSAEDG